MSLRCLQNLPVMWKEQGWGGNDGRNAFLGVTCSSSWSHPVETRLPGGVGGIPEHSGSLPILVRVVLAISFS
jgi:hypothetical protein